MSAVVSGVAAVVAFLVVAPSLGVIFLLAAAYRRDRANAALEIEHRELLRREAS